MKFFFMYIYKTKKCVDYEQKNLSKSSVQISSDILCINVYCFFIYQQISYVS